VLFYYIILERLETNVSRESHNRESHQIINVGAEFLLQLTIIKILKLIATIDTY